jgi:hypothetical protein
MNYRPAVYKTAALPGLSPWICQHLYSYANDDHIDAALKAIVLGVATSHQAERFESDLRLLADVIGGDLQICEISRLLRLPGTHNTKRGENREVVFGTWQDRASFDELVDRADARLCCYHSRPRRRIVRSRGC